MCNSVHDKLAYLAAEYKNVNTPKTCCQFVNFLLKTFIARYTAHNNSIA